MSISEEKNLDVFPEYKLEPEDHLSKAIKCYMQQLLCGLEHCHSHGVLHRDIKGSNLLIDNNGNLKIGDFGLATFFRTDQKQPLTSLVVTLWYRPPELVLGATEYGVAVDLWSSGCILAELFAGKPIMPGRTERRGNLQSEEKLMSISEEKFLDVFPEYKLEPEDHLSKAVIYSWV